MRCDVMRCDVMRRAGVGYLRARYWHMFAVRNRAVLLILLSMLALARAHSSDHYHADEGMWAAYFVLLAGGLLLLVACGWFEYDRVYRVPVQAVPVDFDPRRSAIMV